MRYILITKDVQIAEAARSPAAFPPGDDLEIYERWEDALDAAEGADMIIVDLIATLDEPNKIAGYERFAHAKMDHETAKGVPVVLIAAPDDYELDFMAGFPDFVFAHLRRPVTEKIFRRASTWL